MQMISSLHTLNPKEMVRLSETFGRVLLTGGAGFVGSQLLRRLEPVSEHIYVIDDLSAGSRDAVIESEKVTFYEECYTNEELLREILPRVQWIFHLACRSLTLSVTDMAEDYRVNLFGAYKLLERTRAWCPGLQRLIYTSTASVYGNAPVRPTPESYYQVTTPYSASKMAAEHYVHVYWHQYRMPVTIVRLSNVFGPGQLAANPYCGVVAKFFEALDRKEPFTIYGDGRQTRDFSYIEDVVEAILLAATHPNSVGKLYNIGTGIETSVRELAGHVAAVAGMADYPTVSIPKRQIDHIVHRSVDSRLIRRELQWKPRHTLVEGLEKTYRWLHA